MDETPVSKELFIKGDGYTIRLEYNQEFVIVHLFSIDKFTKEVFWSMHTMLQEWSDFLKAMGVSNLYAAVEKDNIKIKRLLGGLKFKFVGHNDDLTIYRYEV